MRGLLFEYTLYLDTSGNFFAGGVCHVLFFMVMIFNLGHVNRVIYSMFIVLFW